MISIKQENSHCGIREFPASPSQPRQFPVWRKSLSSCCHLCCGFPALLLAAIAAGRLLFCLLLVFLWKNLFSCSGMARRTCTLFMDILGFLSCGVISPLSEHLQLHPMSPQHFSSCLHQQRMLLLATSSAPVLATGARARSFPSTTATASSQPRLFTAKFILLCNEAAVKSFCWPCGLSSAEVNVG